MFNSPLKPIIGVVIGTIIGFGIWQALIPSGGGPTGNNTANIWFSPNGVSYGSAGSNCTAANAYHSSPVTNPDSGNGSTLCSPSAAYDAWPSTCPPAIARGISGNYTSIEILFNQNKSCTSNLGAAPVGNECFPSGIIWQDLQVSTGGSSACLEILPDGVDSTYNLPCNNTFLNLGNGNVGSHGSQNTLNIEVANVFVRCAKATAMTSPYSNPYGVQVGANVGRTATACTNWNVHDVIFDHIYMPYYIVHYSNYVAFEGSKFGDYGNGEATYVSSQSLNGVPQVNGMLANGNSPNSNCSGAPQYQVGSHIAFDHTTTKNFIQTSWSNTQKPLPIQNIVNEQAGVSSITATLPSAAEFANSLIVTVSSDTVVSANYSCQDGNGNALTLIKNQDFGSGGMAVFWENYIGPTWPATTPVASNSVTCASNGGSGNMKIALTELRFARVFPVKNVSGVDQKSSNNTGVSATTSLTTPTITPSNFTGCGTASVGTMIYASVAKDGGGSFGTWGNSYTANGTGNNIATSWIQESSTPSATSSSQSWASNANAGSIIVNFRCENDNHNEGVHVNSSSFLTYSNDRFENVPQQAISVQDAGNAGPGNVTPNDNLFIYNTAIDQVCSDHQTTANSICSAISGGGLVFICNATNNPNVSGTNEMNNVSIAYVTEDQGNGPVSFQVTGCNGQTQTSGPPGSSGPFALTSSILPSCPTAGTITITYQYVATYGACSAGTNSLANQSPSALFSQSTQSYPNFDWSLNATSPAIGLVLNGFVPPTDLIDVTRPGLPADSGAYTTAGAGNKGTGGSSATCSPSPCTPGPTPVTGTVTADDGAGTNTTATYTYRVYRPTNLTNSSTNLVPALFVFSVDTANQDKGTSVANGCDGSGAGNCDWRAIADANNFIIVYVNSNHLLPAAGYATPNVVTPCPHVDGTCTYFGEATVGAACTNLSTIPVTRACYDGPEVTAIMNKLVCSGASPCENIDPNKVFAEGESKGGVATEMAMCDPNLASRFRGFVVTSWELFSTTATQAGPYMCPAVAANTTSDFSVEWLYGDTDSLQLCPGASLQGGCVDGKGEWAYGYDQNVPLITSNATGCNTKTSIQPASNNGGGATTKVFQDTYTGCSIAIRAARVIRFHGCGHAMVALQPCDPNFSAEQEAWNFLSQH